MMAMQPQQAAQGGEIDETSFRHACGLLHAAKRACGGRLDDEATRGSQRLSVLARKVGGEVEQHDVSAEAKRLLRLWDQTEKQNPGMHSDKIFSLMCQKSPGIARLFRQMLSEGYSRGGISAMAHGALIRWADGQ